MQANTQQNDFSKMSADELKRKALELRRQLENQKKVVEEKDRFIKAKMIEEYPELKEELEGLEFGETEDETQSVRQETKKGSPSGNYTATKHINRVSPALQSPGPQTIEKVGPVEPRVEQNKPKADSTFSESTKREIEELRKKLQILEKKEEYTKPQAQVPQTQERKIGPSPVLRSPTREEKPQKISSESENLGGQTSPKFSGNENLGGQRYGVEPAKDLGAGDFVWQGNIGGVEIERSSEDLEEKEELEKTKILEEIEHPPSYTATTNFEKNLGKTSNVAEQKAPEPREEKSKEELEKIRQIRYGGGDPYREPLE